MATRTYEQEKDATGGGQEETDFFTFDNPVGLLTSEGKGSAQTSGGRVDFSISPIYRRVNGGVPTHRFWLVSPDKKPLQIAEAWLNFTYSAVAYFLIRSLDPLFPAKTVYLHALPRVTPAGPVWKIHRGGAGNSGIPCPSPADGTGLAAPAMTRETSGMPLSEVDILKFDNPGSPLLSAGWVCVRTTEGPLSFTIRPIPQYPNVDVPTHVWVTGANVAEEIVAHMWHDWDAKKDAIFLIDCFHLELTGGLKTTVRFAYKQKRPEGAVWRIVAKLDDMPDVE